MVAAGGISDARGIAAAFKLGASGVQIGTAFLACDESNAPQVHKLKLRSKGEAGNTTLMKAYTGRLARGIDNDTLNRFAKNNLKAAPYPIQPWIVSQLKDQAVKNNNHHLLAIWAGQSYPIIKHKKALDLFSDLTKSAQ